MTERYHILIAEDEPRIASFIERGLRREDYATTIVDRGDRALDLSLSGQFDLLVLDIGLPGKDGWTILEELKAQKSPLHVVIVTAQENACERIKAYEGPASITVDCISKPFKFRVLLDCVAHHLG